MDKNLVFLGAEGLTSTSANHIANLAKEYIQDLEYKLSKLYFYTSKVALIGTSNYAIIQEGTDDISFIPKALMSISKAKSLIAWLREGIKAKDAILKNIKSKTIESYCKDNNITLPIKPVMDNVLTEDEYLANLSIKERNKYYTLETECAVLGKFIHPDGAFSNARKDLNDKLKHPHGINGLGRDSVIYDYIPTISVNKIEDLFFDLQTKYRAKQAELNGLKHKIDEAITLSEHKASAKYADEYEVYSNTIAIISARLQTWKVEETKKLQESKLIIPNELKSIYDAINKLGK